MTWDLERYDWARLRAQGSAEGVPRALTALASASTEAEARDAYWRIDNTVVVQGALYEAAVATAACAVVMLHVCSAPGRPRLLELLVQLGSGEPAPSELQAGNADIQERCMMELLRGVSTYFHLLESGSNREREHCVDLLGLCCGLDASLLPRTRWYFERLLASGMDEGGGQLVNNWLEELR